MPILKFHLTSYLREKTVNIKLNKTKLRAPNIKGLISENYESSKNNDK